MEHLIHFQAEEKAKNEIEDWKRRSKRSKDSKRQSNTVFQKVDADLKQTRRVNFEMETERENQRVIHLYPEEDSSPSKSQ